MIFGRVVDLFRKIFKFDKPVSVFTAPEGWQTDYKALQVASWYHSLLQFVSDRRIAYMDVEAMETFDIISSALDLYAEEATQPEFNTQKIVWVETKSDQVLQISNELFEKLDIQERAFTLIRAIAKYGDCFMQLLYNPEDGIQTWKYIGPQNVTRVEDTVGRIIGFAPGIVDPLQLTEDQIKNLTLAKPWDFIHFRRQSVRPDNIHGDSVLLASRRTWRQLKILEDVMVFYRLLRNPDRWAYFLEVGDQTPQQAMNNLNAFRRAMRKREFKTPPVNPEDISSQYRQEFYPISWDDDFFWIMRNGQPQAKVERFEGKGQLLDLGDLEYFRNKLFAALRIPKAVMGFEGEISNRNTLLQQDVRFARTIKSLRQSFVKGIGQLIQIQLAFKGLDPFDPRNKFKVVMAPVSYLDELQRAELYNTKIGIMQSLVAMGRDMELNKKAWFTFILSEIMGLTKQEIDRLLPAEFKGEEPGLGLPPITPPAPSPSVIPPETPAEVPSEVPEKPSPEVPVKAGEAFQGSGALTGDEKVLLEKIVKNGGYTNRIQSIIDSSKATIESSTIKPYVTQQLLEVLKDKQIDLSYREKFFKAVQEVAQKYEEDKKKADEAFLKQLFELSKF